jgi:DedD protein
MPWPTFLLRKKPAAAPSPDPSPVGAPAVVAQARTRARRRLIGAVVLLGLGVIAFPLIFETEPRPIPVDLPIVIPPKDGAPPLAMPAPASAPSVAAMPAPVPAPAPAPVEAASPAAESAPAPAAESPPRAATPAPAAPRAEAPAARPAEPTTSLPATARRDDGQRAQALLEGKAATPPAGRYVVQIGAFASEATVREVRGKAQQAGVQTFTQAVTVSSGQVTRVRVGPFGARAEADAAAAKLRKAGLPATVVKL